MALSVHDCAGYVRRRLDGEPSVPIVTLCNWAGDHLTNMHPWGWLGRPPASLALMAGVPWIDLPVDFGRAIGRPYSRGSSLVAFEWATLDEIASMRSSELTTQLCFYGAIAWIVDSEGRTRPRIELSAEADTTNNAALYLAYRAGWLALTDDDARIPVPWWVEPLYLEVLFAFAQASDEHDLGSQAQRLAEIEMSPAYRAARSRDGGMQPSIGKMSGGAVQMLQAPGARVIGWSGTASDPS
jgi:hypothetical protein